MRKYEPDLPYLLRHLDYVENRIRNPTISPVVNRVAFLQQALLSGYADGVMLPAVTPVIVAVSIAPVPVTPDEIERQQQALTNRAAVWARFQAMAPDVAKSTLVDEFLQQTSRMLKTFYKKNGVNNMIVKQSLTDWLIAERNF